MAVYKRALEYFRPDGWLIGVLLGLIGLSTLLGLLAAWPMAVMVDSVFSQGGHSDLIHRVLLAPLPSSTVGKIIGLAVIGLVIKLSSDALGTIQAIITNRLNYNGLSRVRCDLYRKLQALNLAYHRTQPQGDAIYRLTSDTYGCQAILGGAIGAVVAAVTLVMMTLVLSSRSLALTGLALSVLPVLAAANIVYGKRLSARSVDCKESDTRFMTVVQRSMSTIGLVQAFGREEEEFRQFDGAVRDTIRSWWRLNRQQFAYNTIVGATFALGGAIVFGYGGYLVQQGKLTIGDLMVFTGYLGMLWGPLCTLTGLSTNLQGGAVAARRVFEVLDRDPVIRNRQNAMALPVQPREVRLDGVTFAYPNAKPVLNNVSVTIRPGEMVAFVGASGAGKSTMLNLLPRFFDPVEGAVRFDSIDIRDVCVKDVRKHVALVLQESVVLPVTVAENIAYGKPGATVAEVKAAAELAGAATFIDGLADGYNTVVAEGGSNLSGGQRQRISIARALLTQAPVMVLDEPTSALDPGNERLVTDTLVALKGSRTIVLVSHRLSTVVSCDRIFVLDAGRIVEEGTHYQLIAQGGHYAQMARDQSMAGAGAPAGEETDQAQPQPALAASLAA